MRRERRHLGVRTVFLLLLSLAVGAEPLVAQQTATPQGSPLRVALPATRGDLQGYLAECERLAVAPTVSVEARETYLRNAAVVRDRLSNGDFRVGDQIALSVQGFDSLSKTFVVREGELLSLPGLPDIPLHGVLRSEVGSYLTQQLSRYLRNPDVRATAMLRLAVVGEVRNPGYYRVASDVPLSEALMAAGGLTATSDLNHAVVRRGDREVLSHDALREALASGATVDQLNLRAGDEVFVTARTNRNWVMLIQTTALAASAFVALRAAHIHF